VRCENSFVTSCLDAELWLDAKSEGKPGLAGRVLDVAEGASDTRPDTVGVVFDPDLDLPQRQFAFFERDYNTLSQQRRRGSRLERRSRRGSRQQEYIVTINNRSVRILLAPWRSTHPVGFDNLSNEQDLERVLIEGILASNVDRCLHNWALVSTQELRNLVTDHGWKRAFRIWNAALQPKSESFVDKLLEAPETRSGCLASLRATPVAALIEALLSEQTSG
jgi:hypothetical protein